MNKKTFEAKLKQSLQMSAAMVDETHMQETCQQVRQMMLARGQGRRLSFWQLLSLQMQYIGWKIWGSQAVLLFVVYKLFTTFYEEVFLENPGAVIKMLLCVSITIVMAALPIVYRSVHYQMHEIEAATYYSSAKVLMAKLAVIGIGDVVFLSGIFAVLVTNTMLEAIYAFLYLWVPFLGVSGAALYMLGHLPARRFYLGSMGLCSLLLVLVVVFPLGELVFLTQIILPGWLAVGAFFAIFMLGQCRYIMHGSSYSEMQVE